MSKLIKKYPKNLIQPSKFSKQKIIDLQNVRIMQKNLVYVIGLSGKIANSEILSQKEYFGQYGKILRLIVNNTKAYTGTNVPSYSAYITYSSIKEAALAIIAIDYTTHDDLIIRASFGSTKYCSHFLRSIDCTNKECLYYHFLVDEKDIINNKDDTSNNGKRHTMAIELSDIFSNDTRSKILEKKSNSINNIFPTLDSIYKKDYILELDHNLSLSKNSTNCNSKLKSILNREKSPKIKPFKEDLKNLFNKKLLTKVDKESTNLNIENNEISTNSSNDEKFIPDLKKNYLDLIIEQNNILKDQNIMKSSIFLDKIKSRFNFVEELITENDDNVSVPKKINEIITKKTSTYYFMKNIDLNASEDYIKKHCDNKEWTDFIINIKK